MAPSKRPKKNTTRPNGTRKVTTTPHERSDRARRALSQLDAIEVVLRRWRRTLETVARNGTRVVGFMNHDDDDEEVLRRVTDLVDSLLGVGFKAVPRNMTIGMT